MSKTIQRDEVKKKGPSRDEEPPCKSGCVDAASFAVPWAEGTESTSTGPFPTDLPRVSKALGTAALLQGGKSSFPGVSTGQGLQLAMVTLSLHSGVQCFPLLYAFLLGLLIF